MRRYGKAPAIAGIVMPNSERQQKRVIGGIFLISATMSVVAIVDVEELYVEYV